MYKVGSGPPKPDRSVLVGKGLSAGAQGRFRCSTSCTGFFSCLPSSLSGSARGSTPHRRAACPARARGEPTPHARRCGPAEARGRSSAEPQEWHTGVSSYLEDARCCRCNVFVRYGGTRRPASEPAQRELVFGGCVEGDRAPAPQAVRRHDPWVNALSGGGVLKIRVKRAHRDARKDWIFWVPWQRELSARERYWAQHVTWRRCVCPRTALPCLVVLGCGEVPSH